MKIPIFLTIDNDYAPYAACAISSIAENSNKDNDYEIIILYQNLEEKSKKKLIALETRNLKITFKEMKDEFAEITDREENKLRCDYFTLTIYFRLFIADMFEEYDKGIYIDSDVIVPGDISEMYNIDLKDNLIGACTDMSVQEIPEIVNYMEGAIGVDRMEYINSGVLLMNLKKLREINFAQKFLKLLSTYHFDSIAPDQDYINAMCNGKILYLDTSWDTMPNKNTEPLKEPRLIHYNLFEKPWCYDNIQYEEYFWKYANKSDFYGEIMKNKKEYSEEKKELDRKCLAELIEKASRLHKEEKTFKHKYEDGEIIRVWL